MPPTPRHKVFISYHDEDRAYKKKFVRMMGNRVIDKSVEVNDIDDSRIETQTIRRKIRDDFIADATVTIVLIGPCTWRRKHVDWEIGSSLRKTKRNSRCGLLGILLPNHPDHGSGQFAPPLMPPRLTDNCKGDDPYAFVYSWPKPWAPARVAGWIHEAFNRRTGTPPNNKRKSFNNNRSRPCSAGWQN